MDSSSTKELLHLRIEQADERMLTALAELTETLFKTWQPDVAAASSVEKVPPWAKPMTKDESLADLREGLAQYEAGEYLSLEESDKEVASW